LHPNPSTTAKAEHSATDEASGADTPTRAEVARWRRWLGISLFMLHVVLPVVLLIVVPIFGLPESPNAILIGKDGVAELMSKLGSLAKRITKWVAQTGSVEGAWFDLELVCPEFENHLKVVRGVFVRILGRGKDIEHIELEYNLADSVPIAL
jgi:hypothetical protein